MEYEYISTQNKNITHIIKLFFIPFQHIAVLIYIKKQENTVLLMKNICLRT